MSSRTSGTIPAVKVGKARTYILCDRCGIEIKGGGNRRNKLCKDCVSDPSFRSQKEES